ncbi:MAG: hypothetical protein QOE34_2881 [Verrucomicrobiota bacterium]|jgi:hypothetical protein
MKTNCIVRINTAVAAILIALAFAIASQPTLASGGSTNSGGGGGTTVTSGYITAFKVIAGYPPRGNGVWVAAIWTNFSVKANPAVYTPYVRLRLTNVATGQSGSMLYPFASQTIDADAVLLDSTYLVELEVLDNSGNVVDSRNATVTTPPAKVATTP